MVFETWQRPCYVIGGQVARRYLTNVASALSTKGQIVPTWLRMLAGATPLWSPTYP